MAELATWPAVAGDSMQSLPGSDNSWSRVDYDRKPGRRNGTADEDIEAVSFGEALNGYLTSRGIEQKRRRSGLASRVATSLDPRKRIRQVLDAIADCPSQDRMAAAIDLLSLVGPAVCSVALDTALPTGDLALTSEKAFVVGSAAGRADPKVIHRILLLSDNEALREAAVELLAGLPEEEAKPVLARLSAGDPSDYIRDRAKELLEEMG